MRRYHIKTLNYILNYTRQLSLIHIPILSTSPFPLQRQTSAA